MDSEITKVDYLNTNCVQYCTMNIICCVKSSLFSVCVPTYVAIRELSTSMALGGAQTILENLGVVGGTKRLKEQQNVFDILLKKCAMIGGSKMCSRIWEGTQNLSTHSRGEWNFYHHKTSQPALTPSPTIIISTP